MDQQISIPVSLYERLGAHVKGFETPAQVIERLLDYYENGHTSPSTTSTSKSIEDVLLNPRLDVTFIPRDQNEFKRLFLERKKAWVVIYKTDGNKVVKQWEAHKFTADSHLLGNLRSGYLRGWRDKKICRALVVINEEDIERV